MKYLNGKTNGKVNIKDIDPAVRGLRSELPQTIDVKVINPGFVKTGLTAKNNFEMPMMITPEKAATFIADGLLRKSFEIHFSKKFTFFLQLIQFLRYCLSTKIATQLNVRKKASC